MFKFLLPVALLVLVVEALTGGPAIVATDPGPAIPVTSPVASSIEGLTLAPVLVADGLDSPTDVVADPLSDRLFVVEKPGTIRVMEGDGTLLDRPFADLTRWVGSEGNEQGLLSLRFHPGYAENGRFFVFFTDPGGTSQLAEAKVDPNDPYHLVPGTLRRVRSFPQYGQYHQSGSMMFGPDGLLWLSLGDGGGIGDPLGHGQDTENIDASIIRIDVDHGRPYGIPSDNPFVGEPGLDEIWAFGLRNPWRISFDAQTGLVYIPDVGQEGVEELNVVGLDDAGRNFGWSVSEGSGCYEADTCDMDGHTLPVYQYPHAGNGCAIIGGRVYRGSLMPEVIGHYFFADFCLGWIRSVVLDDERTYLVVDWTTEREDRLGTVTTIGSDRSGELYVANLEGEIWRLELARGQ